MARPNHLSTPWGPEDVIALAEAGVTCMLYPKVQTPDDLHQVQALLREHGADPDIYVCIESARAVVELERIATVDKVVGLSFGPGDLSVDCHMAEFEPDGTLNPGYVYPEMRTVITGVAFGRATVNLNVVPDIKDLARVRAQVERSKRLGFSSSVAFYPPHIDIINQVFSPSADEIARATEIVDAYVAAQREGRPAVQLANGEVLLVHEYTKAQHLLARAGRELAVPTA
jgi:citrate lyase beta subunit